MGFETQSALLRYLWKNENDRSLVQRMMSRGEILRRDWMYILVDKDLEIKELRSKIATLERSKYNTEVVVDSSIIELLRNHLSYVWQRNEHRRACIDKMVQSFYVKNSSKYDFDTAKEKFYEIIWFSEDLDEEDERKFAIDEWLLPF